MSLISFLKSIFLSMENVPSPTAKPVIATPVKEEPAKEAVKPVVLSSVHMKYKFLFTTADISFGKTSEIDLYVKRIISGKVFYDKVSEKLGNGIPWYFIGILHFMEIGHKFPNHFKFHLHCGDPLTNRTVNVPSGRPIFNPGNTSRRPSVNNPYSWFESAVDAMKHMGFDKVIDWSVWNQLFLFEKYNGGGYLRKGINSPYLWNYTNHYGTPPNIGKYVSDGKFNPTATSKQAGAAAILLRLLQSESAKNNPM